MELENSERQIQRNANQPNVQVKNNVTPTQNRNPPPNKAPQNVPHKVPPQNVPQNI